MTSRNKTIASVGAAMAAGGFTASLLAISPLLKAGVVGIVAAAVMGSMLMILPTRPSRD